MIAIKIEKFIEYIECYCDNDIYIVVKYHNQIRRTTTQMNNNEPIWNETFLFEKTQKCELIIEVWDYDKWGANNMIQSYSCMIINPYEICQHILGPVSVVVYDVNHIQKTTNDVLINTNKTLINKYDILVNQHKVMAKTQEILYDNYSEIVEKNNILDRSYIKLSNIYNDANDTLNNISSLLKSNILHPI
jgi:hypothetical protein